MTIELDRDCTLTKVCTKCKIEKALNCYGNAGRGDDRLRSYCKDCAAAYRNSSEAQERTKANRARYNENRRARYDPLKNKLNKIRHTYGLMPETYYSILEKQHGRCAICNDELVITHIDHCHNSGIVRGILCGQCNTALGQFKDSIDVLESAVKYLRRFK